MTVMYPPQTPTAAADAQPAWPLWLRVLFRFGFVYWVLYILPSPGAVSLFDLPPWNTEKMSNALAWPLGRLAHWAGVHVFHFTGQAADWHPTGSGDTAMNYALFAVTVVLALLGAVAWSAVDEGRARGRKEYRTAYAWLRLFLRFTLASTLLVYGFTKIFPGQFGLAPQLFELNETYGESSPMHVLWFFMTVSRPYTVFGGLMEALPGVLLLFRRTSTVGLLGSAAVMANVVAMNFCYDVPVKLYSTHLLLMSLFLLLPDMRPMWEFFVRRQHAALTGVWVRKPERKALRLAGHLFQAAVVLCCAWGAVQTYKSRQTPRQPSPLQGVWAVDSIEGWNDGSKPTAITLGNDEYVLMKLENGKRRFLTVKYDAAQHMAKLKMDKETSLHWETSDPRKVQMRGTWMGAPVTLAMHRTDPDSYLLTTRGFHWVTESAFNR